MTEYHISCNAEMIWNSYISKHQLYTSSMVQHAAYTMCYYEIQWHIQYSFLADLGFMLQHLSPVWYIHSAYMAGMNDDLSKRCL